MTTTTPSLLSDTPARHTRSHDKSSATSSTASRAAAANNDDAYSSSSSPTLTAAPSPPPHGAFASEPSSATFRDSSSGSSTSSFATADENDDDELSDGEITRLLREAEDRMKYGGSALTLSTSNQSVVRYVFVLGGAGKFFPLGTRRHQTNW